MSTINNRIRTGLFAFLLAISFSCQLSAREAAGQFSHSLNLQQAINIAQQADPWLQASQHQQAALAAQSIAAAQLQDPTLSISMANLPTDSFDFSQEPMTQFKLGVSQRFEPGESRALKRKKLAQLSEQHPYLRQDRKARIQMQVSELFLQALLAQQSVRLIEQNRSLFEQLSDLVQASYASAAGKARQQDLIRSQLELTRLEDRLSQLRQQKDIELQALGQWMSARSSGLVEQATNYAQLNLDAVLPEIQIESRFLPPAEPSNQQLLEYFAKHPALVALENKIRASDTNVELAKQSRKPSWGMNASYGYRDDDPFGNRRADFVSIGFTMELPMFTKNRQDKEVSASVSQLSAVKTERWQLLRALLAGYRSAHTELARLEERRQLYQQHLLPQMHEQAEASLTAYTNDDGDFAEVVRARIAELNSEIDALTIEIQQASAKARIAYYLTQVSTASESASFVAGE